MILELSYLEDLKCAIQEEPNETFQDAGVDKDTLLADNDTMEKLWANYQKSIQEYGVDPDYAFHEALCEVLSIPVLPAQPVLPRFAIVVVQERDILAVKEVHGLDDAVDAANELLAAHMVEIDRSDEFETGDEKQDEWDTATAETKTAWCNYGTNWDAHVIPMDKT